MGRGCGVADRATLALSKLDEFAEWAAVHGWVREPTRGRDEILRLRHSARRHPFLAYGRSPEHATVPRDPDGREFNMQLVRRWIRERRRADPLPTPTPELPSRSSGAGDGFQVGPDHAVGPWTDGDADAAGVTARDVEEMKK